MSIIEEKCKQKGVRLTDQRKVIAKILSESKEVYGSKDHPDVDELHKRVTAIDVPKLTVNRLKVSKFQITTVF